MAKCTRGSRCAPHTPAPHNNHLPGHGNAPPPAPRWPAGNALVTVYGENWTAEKQTLTMQTTFSEWVADSGAVGAQ
jgi:hypothetical protein